jgi:pimeloyl-ACP methyl ester carboxylesterase
MASRAHRPYLLRHRLVEMGRRGWPGEAPGCGDFLAADQPAITHTELSREERMSADPLVVLLHGAGTGPWVWDRVISALDMPAVALDLHGRDDGGRDDGGTPEGCALSLAAEIERFGAESVVVVAHSLAGVLAADLSAKLGPRLRRIVFVSAVVPEPGRSFARTMGFPVRLILPLLFRFNRNGLKPSPAMIRDELCNDLDDADTEMVISRYRPEKPGLFLSRVSAPGPEGPTTYVRSTADRSISPAFQSRMIARLGSPRVREVEAGHLAMLSRPTELARIICDETAAE